MSPRLKVGWVLLGGRQVALTLSHPSFVLLRVPINRQRMPDFPPRVIPPFPSLVMSRTGELRRISSVLVRGLMLL